MSGLTLIPESLAKPGYRFQYLGENPGDECKGCPVQKLCFRLDPGRRYEVQQARDVVHPCNLHDEGKVRVCTVEEVPMATSTERRSLRGTALHWTPVPCGYPECARYAFCHPVGPVPGSRFEVLKEGKAIECPMHYDLVEVTLRPMPE